MLLEIEKFDRSMSFALWQVKMRAVLTQQGLQKAILGKEKMDKNLTKEQKEELDEKALALIQLCLSNEVLREVICEKTTSGVWLKLESLYMTKSLTNKLVLKQKLIMLRMAEGTSIKAHLDEFSSIILDLENIDEVIEDEDKAPYLLCSLPPSYNNFRENFLYGRDSISLDEIKASLISK